MRKVVIYHRAPGVVVKKDDHYTLEPPASPNGILPFLRSSLKERDIWICCGAHSEQMPSLPEHLEFDGINVLFTDVLEAHYRTFYHKTSKETFWSLLHSHGANFSTSEEDWQNFVNINKDAATKAAQTIEEGDIVSVHDYNFWLVPGFLRALRPNSIITFFHHTPFPANDIFSIIPKNWKRQIVKSLLACDSVGFHTPAYARNFFGVLESEIQINHYEISEVPRIFRSESKYAPQKYVSKVQTEDHDTYLDVFPVGVSVDRLYEAMDTQEFRQAQQLIQEQYSEKKLFTSLSRCDFAKGNLELLYAFERLLERNPDRVDDFKLVLLCAPAAKGMKIYEQTQLDLEKKAGQVNAKYKTNPVNFCTDRYSVAEVLALLSVTDFCIIPPKRDGQNLVASEFIVAKYFGACDGALLLSEFTGASALLHSALSFNPYHTQSFDSAIDTGLLLTEGERKKQVESLFKEISNVTPDKFWNYFNTVISKRS